MEGAKVDPDNGHATGLVETGGERKEGSLFKFRSLGGSIWPAGRQVTTSSFEVARLQANDGHISNLLVGLPVHIIMDQVRLLYCCWDT